jgi:hypothetical protein
LVVFGAAQSQINKNKVVAIINADCKLL